MKRAYVCNRLPYLRIGVGSGRPMVSFQDGLYETENEAEIEAIERAMNHNPIVRRDLPEEMEASDTAESEVGDEIPPPEEDEAGSREASEIETVSEGLKVGSVGTEHMKGIR